jgi:hypothetical protein
MCAVANAACERIDFSLQEGWRFLLPDDNRLAAEGAKVVGVIFAIAAADAAFYLGA